MKRRTASQTRKSKTFPERKEKMKKFFDRKSVTVAALAAALVLGSALLSGAASRETPTIKNLSDVSSLFDSHDSVTEYGIVLEVNLVPYSKGRVGGATATVLKVASLDGEYLAYMGPTNFFERQKVTFAPGEPLLLRGVRARMGDEKWLISRVFSKNDGAMVVRGPKGNLGDSILSDSLACAENVSFLCQR